VQWGVLSGWRRRRVFLPASGVYPSVSASPVRVARRARVFKPWVPSQPQPQPQPQHGAVHALPLPGGDSHRRRSEKIDGAPSKSYKRGNRCSRTDCTRRVRIEFTATCNVQLDGHCQRRFPALHDISRALCCCSDCTRGR
jgi:hypothetical protein